MMKGALIVSTPQDVALIDARRGVKLFSKVNVQILGILENMSYFKCPNCSGPYYIFGKGGAQKTADEMGMKFLGEIPLEVGIKSASDDGVPIVISDPDSFVSKAYCTVAENVASALEDLAKGQHFQPEITYKYGLLAFIETRPALLDEFKEGGQFFVANATQ